MIFVQSWRIKEDISILPLTIPVNYPPILTGTHWLEAVELISDHVLHFSYIRLIPSLLRSLKGHCKSCRKRFISDMPRFNFVDLIIVFFSQKDFFSLIFSAKEGSQQTSGVTGKFGLGVQNEAGQRLIEFCQQNVLVKANTFFQLHKRRLYPWTSPDGWHQNQIDYILCSQRWRSPIQSAKTRPGADYGSDHDPLLPNSDLNWRK